MSAGRALVRDTVLIELGREVLHLTDAGVEHVELGVLHQSDRERRHVTTVHTAVGQEALERDAELLAAFVPLGFVGRDKSAHVHQTVFLGTHRHGVHVTEHLASDLFDRLVGISCLTGLDEIGVLRKARRVHVHRHAVLMAEFASSLDIRHRDGLSAYGVVRDGEHHERHIAFVLTQHFLQFLQTHIALERRLELGVFGIIARHVDSEGLTRLDMTLRGIEMRITRDDLAGLNQIREQHVLRRTTLVRRDDIIETRERGHDLFELEERTGTRVALVAHHHRRPLTVGHRTRTGIG